MKWITTPSLWVTMKYCGENTEQLNRVTLLKIEFHFYIHLSYMTFRQIPYLSVITPADGINTYLHNFSGLF